MRINLQILKRYLVSVVIFFQVFSIMMPYAYAQELTPILPSPTESVTPTDEPKFMTPTPTETPIPTIITPIPTETKTLELTDDVSDLNETLPGPSTSPTIKDLAASDITEQQKRPNKEHIKFAQRNNVLVIDLGELKDFSVDKLDVEIDGIDTNEIKSSLTIRKFKKNRIVEISPLTNYKPGNYHLTLSYDKELVFEQDFSWGVLAINTPKSVYSAGEKTRRIGNIYS